MKKNSCWGLGLAFIILLGLAGLLLLSPVTARAETSLAVYSDSLNSDWGDWSWNISSNYNNTSPVHQGSHSLSVTFSQGWDGLQFGRNDALDISAYDTLRFYIHGGSQGGQSIAVQVNGSEVASLTAQAGTWKKVDISLNSLGYPRSASTLIWFNNTDHNQPVFYLDDISFVNTGQIPTPLPTQGGPQLQVDPSVDQHPISPDIYGMSYTNKDLAQELKLPVRRWGGNSTTRYNWKNDTSNHAMDWYFENIPEENNHPELLPDNSAANRFIEQNQETGTQTILTVPLIGWTPKERAYACGYSITKYGAQQYSDPWRPDCGNGKRTNGSLITTNNPTDTSQAITPSFVQDWMRYLLNRYGSANNGGVRYYNLDNEPMLWNDTHRDVHPDPTSYDEMKTRTYQYAAAIKAVDPQAKTLGPVVWGWTAYFWSALDRASGGEWWNHPQDRLAHNNTPFLEWYLQQMRAYEQEHQLRILDYLDVHFYPQGDGIFSESVGSSDVQALRLRSTRALWDPSYKDESWIDTPVYLIPRMHQWVQNNYPGTRLAVTEYSWGANGHINGALAEADVLGIFGREGLDLAALWGPPGAQQPVAYAFRMYLNYDGLGSQFGDISVQASSTDSDKLAVFASQRTTDQALTIMVINKTGIPLESSVNILHAKDNNAVKVFRYSPTNLAKIEALSDLALSGGQIKTVYAPNSINLLVIPNGAMPPTPRTISPLYMPLIEQE